MSYGVIIGHLLFGSLDLIFKMNVTKSYGVTLVTEQGEGFNGLYIYAGSMGLIIVTMPKGWRKNCPKVPFLEWSRDMTNNQAKILIESWRRDGVPTGRNVRKKIYCKAVS
ncbi:hypothetical protein FACS1894137_11190 [Spirochaetia bacterium]|nr:hypothetical protein FACS1894137_11190 [Spirochaetia bacterium]